MGKIDKETFTGEDVQTANKHMNRWLRLTTWLLGKCKEVLQQDNTTKLFEWLK